jgi:hypothetical protein
MCRDVARLCLRATLKAMEEAERSRAAAAAVSVPLQLPGSGGGSGGTARLTRELIIQQVSNLSLRGLNETRSAEATPIKMSRRG